MLVAHNPVEVVEGKYTRPTGNLLSCRVTISPTALTARSHLLGFCAVAAEPSGAVVIEAERSRTIPTLGHLAAQVEGTHKNESAHRIK